MKQRLSFKNVTVDFPIYDANSRSLKRSLVMNKVSEFVSRSSVGGSVRRDSHGVVTVRALDNINFQLEDGDRVAILGHNGSGKTTMLRVAAGIYEPVVGEVVAHGRVMPLFNMMEGLAPDASGLEMIRVRGSLLGLTERDIEEKIGEILEFCDLGDYIDMPVRTYSTGMLVRLMFAITTSIESEILIMDEFIGAGDAAFFERAQARLKTFVGRASVLLVATHSVAIAHEWCSKAMLLSHGRLMAFGKVGEVQAAYERLTHPQ
jgi:ABC-type polysaccharide/polyol phosphate transport system ATPase subunit